MPIDDCPGRISGEKVGKRAAARIVALLEGNAVSTDLTGNGTVEVDDLLGIINSWGNCAAPCPADINGNGVVDVDDLLAVLNDWT